MEKHPHLVLPREILDARELRASRQQKMLKLGGHCVISFTLNIAGPIKTSPLIQKSFQEGLRQIERQLKRCNATILKQEYWLEKTGCEALFSVAVDEVKIKFMMIAIEEGSALGRLFDIDVLSKDGYPISRSKLGLARRRCLVCECLAHECARSQRHDLSIIQEETERIMDEYFLIHRADFVAATACRSLLYEVCVTPKPGLVDRNNSGAHQDMDIFTFMDSTAVLTPHFRNLFLLGVQLKSVAPEQLLNRLRYAGLMAEDDMLEATNKTNTHKGLIFSLGILCGALGWSEANQRPSDIPSLLSLCGEIARPSIESDLQDITIETASTSGERFFVKSGNAGARGEAAAGFPSVLFWGLPTLRGLINKGFSLNDAGVYTLLSLMGQVTDTNIISRCGHKSQQRIQKLIQDMLSEPSLPTMDNISTMDLNFIKQNISPGGCADLLAITFMLYFLEEEEVKKARDK